jgi:hypothetical protein
MGVLRRKMMSIFPGPLELVEKIILETRSGRAWVALSIGGCGILAYANIGRHLRGHQEERSIALTFASSVLYALEASSVDSRPSTPQILANTADAVIDEPEHVSLVCTTWKCLPGGIELCSIGANTVLAFEGETIRQIIAPDTVCELLKSQGKPSVHGPTTHIAMKALGSKKNSGSATSEDVRVAVVPLLPTTIIAVIGHVQLAEDIIAEHVPGHKLSSFIEAWDREAKKARTSILLSL